MNFNFKIFKLLVTHRLEKANMLYRSKFHQNCANNSKDIVKVWIFYAFGFFCCFGVNNRTKWKLLHCNPSSNALTWNWRCGGYCAPRCQILSMSDKQFLRFCVYHFFKRQRPTSWIFINFYKFDFLNNCYALANMTFHFLNNFYALDT